MARCIAFAQSVARLHLFFHRHVLRRSKEDHNGISDEFIDGPTMLEDDFVHHREVLIQHTLRFFWAQSSEVLVNPLKSEKRTVISRSSAGRSMLSSPLRISPIKRRRQVAF